MKKLSEIPGVKTKDLSASDVRRGTRVRIADSGSKHFGDLGTVSAVSEGCSCRDGWCRVLLDNGKREEFRYGYRGDVSDLLKIVKEPERAPIAFVDKYTVAAGDLVQVWAGSEEYYRDSERGKASVISVEGSWVKVMFGDRSTSEYRVKDGDQNLVVVPETQADKTSRLAAEVVAKAEADAKAKAEAAKAKAEAAAEAKLVRVTKATAKKGARVRIASDSEFSDQNSGLGTIMEDEDTARTWGWVNVKFDNGYFNSYRYGVKEGGRLDGQQDLILVSSADGSSPRSKASEPAQPEPSVKKAKKAAWKAAKAKTKGRVPAEVEAEPEVVTKVTYATALRGARVKIHRDSRHFGKSKAVGTIVGFTCGGHATVKFDDGYSGDFLYGHHQVEEGASDLALVEPAPRT